MSIFSEDSMVTLISLYDQAIEIENLVKGFDEIRKMSFEGDDELKEMYLNVYRAQTLDGMGKFTCLIDEAMSEYPGDQNDIVWFKRKVSEMVKFDNLVPVT